MLPVLALIDFDAGQRYTEDGARTEQRAACRIASKAGRCARLDAMPLGLKLFVIAGIAAAGRFRTLFHRKQD